MTEPTTAKDRAHWITNMDLLKADHGESGDYEIMRRLIDDVDRLEGEKAALSKELQEEGERAGGVIVERNDALREKAALYEALRQEHYQYHGPGSDLDDCGPSVRKTCLLLIK